MTLSAQLETEIYTDGVVLPRTSAELIQNPHKGQIIYDEDIDRLKFYDGASWKEIGMAKNQQKVINSQLFSKDGIISNNGILKSNYIRLSGYSYVLDGARDIVYAPIDIPVGAELTSVSLICLDDDPNRRISITVTKDRTLDGTNSSNIAPNGSALSIDGISTYQSVQSVFSGETREPGESYYVRIVSTDNQTDFPNSWSGHDLRLSKLIINYKLP